MSASSQSVKRIKMSKYHHFECFFKFKCNFPALSLQYCPGGDLQMKSKRVVYLAVINTGR